MFIAENKLLSVMAEEEIPIPASTMVLFIDTQQVDLASKYHSFELVSINYISEGKDFLKAKLSRIELMVGRYLVKCQYELGIGLGK